MRSAKFTTFQIGIRTTQRDRNIRKTKKRNRDNVFGIQISNHLSVSQRERGSRNALQLT